MFMGVLPNQKKGAKMFATVVSTWILVQALLVPSPLGWQYEYHTIMGPFSSPAACNGARDIFLAFAASNPNIAQNYLIGCLEAN